MRNARRRRALLSSAALVAVLVPLFSCTSDSDETTLELPRTAQELEAAARRGDSMAAMIAVGQTLADTVGRALRGDVDPQQLARAAAARIAESSAERLSQSAADSADENTPALATGTGDALTQRALRRADSLSRVSAAEMTRKLAPAAGRATGDSLRGVLEIEKSASGGRVVLKSPSARMPVVLAGMATSDLVRLSGFEVAVRGARMSPREFVVSAFALRAANGVPVADGVLINTGNAWTLQLADGGQLRLPRASPTLQSLVGERVWVEQNGSANPGFGLVLRRR